MTRQQKARVHVPAAIGIALVAAISLLALGELNARNSDVEAALEAYDNLHGIAALKGQFKNQDIAAEREARTDLFFNAGGTAANDATLLATVKSIANAIGVQILSSEEMSSKISDGGFGINLQISGTTTGINQFLEQIEKQSPLILINSFMIHGAALGQGNEQAEPPLTMGISLRGQMMTVGDGG